MLQNLPHTRRNLAAVANCEYTCALCTQYRLIHVVGRQQNLYHRAAAAAKPISIQ